MAMVNDIQTDIYNKPIQYFITARPWLDLYGNRIRVTQSVFQSEVDLSLLHRKIPDELLHDIFARMSPYTLGRASCVCRKWRNTLRNPVFWRAACLQTWQKCDEIKNRRILSQQYAGSWRRMWLLRPRLRYDGIYVSRNTYLRQGDSQWRVANPAQLLVCYYRYFRFFPNGKFLYKISSFKLKEVAKTFNRRSRRDDIYGGTYTLTDTQVDTAIVHPGRFPTVVRMRLRVRGTTVGASNRLDLVLLITTGLNESEAGVEEEEVLNTVENWEEGETHSPNVPAVTHMKGAAPFVFVPFEEVETSDLNLPVDVMDYYVSH